MVGGQDDFRKSLDAVLKAERADEVMNVVWLGDGAPENWTMATELCPFATQVLDLMHAVQNAKARKNELRLGPAGVRASGW